MKRRIALIMLLLAGGAIVNVAVAWGLYAKRGLGSGSLVTFHEPQPWGHTYSRRFHSWGYTAYQFEQSPWETELSGTVVERMVKDIRDTLPRGVDLLNGEPTIRWVATSGWPLRALYTSEVHPPLRLKEIPYIPLPIGFIINTGFYAQLLWLLFFAPFTARRMLRRRRGLCEKCAYPIGVSPVCTECGAAIPRKVET